MFRGMLLATLIWTFGSRAGAQAEPEKFRLVRGYVLLQVEINQRGPFLMLLDTGAESSVLTPEAARQVGLGVNGRVALEAAGGDGVAAAGRAEQVTVGDASAEAVEFLVMPLTAMRTIDEGIQGVLGQSFVARFPSLIDYRSRRVWFGAEAVARAAGLPVRVAAEWVRDRAVLPVRVGAREYRMVLDSGSADLVLRCSGECPRLTGSEEAQARSNTGDRRVVRGWLREAEVGSLRIAQPAVALLPGAGEDDGMMPARWFSAVYMDPGARVVRLAR